MRLPITPNTKSLCEQCVALCCRYYAFQIEKPRTKRDFDDIRWYLLHEDTIVFVEDGDWYLQVNRKCKALRPDNRCAVYENRPAICRTYKTGTCDWHGDEYDYQELFTEPEQLARYAKEYLAKRRKRQAAARKRAAQKSAAPRQRPARRTAGKKVGAPLRLLKSA